MHVDYNGFGKRSINPEFDLCESEVDVYNSSSQNQQCLQLKILQGRLQFKISKEQKSK
jgi:hypothetical protein